MVRDCKTMSFFSVGCPYRRKFAVFMGLQEKLFGVKLTVPLLRSSDYEARLSELKSFCGGLIEGKVHRWHAPCARLSRSSRWSIAMSLFLFRKVLPSLEPDLNSYVDKMSSPGPSPDPAFMSYCERKMDSMFPAGWDAGIYEASALNATIPLKACVQENRASGGARYCILNRSDAWNTHHDYVMETLVRENPISLLPSRIAAVETAGKYRIVSVGDAEMNLFRPLHTAIYSHISRKKWLLRGDAKASRFDEEFRTVQGELFCSGDYESATDNLSQEISQCILDVILRNATSVPVGIRVSAPLMLETMFSLKDGPVVQQARGQLMGNLLSFPLLCIVNYLAFRYYSGSGGVGSKSFIPVRINGDDIVFRAPRSVIDRWMAGVRGAGLTLSMGKTLVDGRFFTLNSTLFQARPKGVSLVPMIRSTAFGFRKDCGGVETLAGRWSSFAPGFTGARRSRCRVEFLRWNSRWIFASGRSCSRGLGLNPSRDDLMKATLWDRECYYLSFEEGVEKPIPLKPSFLEQERKPPGWELRRVEKITKEMRKLQKEIGPAFVAAAWSPLSKGVVRDTNKEWMDAISHSGLSYPIRGIRDRMKKKARLLGLSPRNARRYLSPRLDEKGYRAYVTRNRRRVWLPIEYATGLAALGFIRSKEI